MAGTDLDRVLEQIRQNRARFERDEASRVAPVIPTSRPSPASRRIGARVLDTVSGLEGEIVSGTRENFIIPPAER